MTGPFNSAQQPLTQYSYDAKNRRTKVVYPDETSTNPSHDVTTYAGLEKTLTKSNGQVTSTYQHRNGDLLQTVDAHNNAMTYIDGRCVQSDAAGVPSIALPEAEHALIPTLSGPYAGTARDLLARDIRNLRNFTNAPNNALQDLVDLNKQMYPEVFAK